MPLHVNPTAAALATAVTNDSRAIVSARDARNIVRIAVAQIESSDAPSKSFDASERLIEAAVKLLGTSKTAKRVLASFESRGKNAIQLRLEEMTGTDQLPIPAANEFKGIVDGNFWNQDKAVGITNVSSYATNAYEFDYTIEGEDGGKAYALKYEGSWLLAPRRLTPEIVDQAVEAMRAYFDEYVAGDIRDNYFYDYDTPAAMEAEIVSMRASIGAGNAYFPFEGTDPYDMVNDYPYLFGMSNPTGSDEGYFAGVNPETGGSDAYTFN